MSRLKHALLSPAVNAQQAIPSEEDETRLFEDKFGQMAYQAFTAKYPDLVSDIVTFKILDTDIQSGTAVAAFILEKEGEFIYVPTVLADNQLKPFDIMYVKSKDIFLPLSAEWITETSKGALTSLGEGSQLPDTVATDVDIRNLIVPPTTGRYSYASYDDISPRTRLLAAATEPLGRRLTKLAMGPFPDPSGGQNSSGQVGGSGSATDADFNPEIWTTFVEQFQRINNMTPGQALDSASLDLETMAKMYKSHAKTWEMAHQAQMSMQGIDPAAAAQGAMGAGAPVGAQGQGQGQPAPANASPGPMGPGTAGMMPSPKMANVQQQAVERVIEPTVGELFDRLVNTMGRGAAMGGVSGGMYAASDRDLSDVPQGILHGAVGGAVGAPVGGMLGGSIATRNPKLVKNPAQAKALGQLLGGVSGGYLGAHADPRSASQLLTPSEAAMQDYYQDRTAADYTAGIKAMIKHARAGASHSLNLPKFLQAAPNNVKVAFATVLKNNSRLLKTAADIYGTDALVRALQLKKEAGTVSMSGGALYVADKDTTPKKYEQAFGSDAAEAFQGVLMRGYYFKDTRPKLNLAVQAQAPKDFQEANEPGVYRIFSTEGTPRTALVLVDPTSLAMSDRAFYPKDKRYPEKDTAKLVIFDNGDYMETHNITGELVVDGMLKGSTLYKKLMATGTASPTTGKGVFVYKRGQHYFGTRVVTIKNLSTGSDGVVRGSFDNILQDVRFVIDPRSPITKAIKPSGADLVVIPSHWKWLPLKDSVSEFDYLRSPSALMDIALDALKSVGVNEAVARSAGQDMFSVNGEKTTSKKEALFKLATDFNIHASAAEAMLKIAEAEGVCRTFVASPIKVAAALYRVKTAQGEVPPTTPMGAPPAMQQPPPAATPAATPASPVDQAFSEAMSQIQSQLDALQSQLGVLTTVQQRAQEIAAQQGGAPMQGMPQGMAPGMATDPAASASPQMPAQAGMQPSDPAAMQQGQQPQDPNAQQQQGPGVPIMRTEQPSSQEIANQVNPDFLQQAGQFQDAGAFDAGAIASLSKSPSLKSLGSQYAANLEDSVDDLGRTLLTLYMQEPKLKEQLGDETFTELEGQLRDTFHGLGNLVLSLTHNTAMLESDAFA